MVFNRFLLGLILLICLLLQLPNATVAQEVEIPVTGIRLDKTEIVLGLGEEEELQAIVYPWNASNRSVYWVSSDHSVLKLEPHGLTATLKPQSAGEAVITVSTVDQGFFIQCNVTVVIRVDSLGIDKKDITLAPGEKIELQAWVVPRDATEQGISWHSTDPGIVTVNEKGEIVAKRQGQARIIASSVENDRITVFSEVTVTEEESAEPVQPAENGVAFPIDPGPDLASNLYVYIIGAILVLLIVALTLFLFVRKKKSGQSSIPAEAIHSGQQQLTRPLLVGLSGTFAGQVIKFQNNQATIGRDPGSQAAYPSENSEVSRKHCTIYFDPASRKFSLVDTSSNGTYWINGERLEPNKPYTIEPGARFSLAEANETFTVELE